ncbi:hypothetical protein M9Y10_018561 [Tritrichomonas musculus]|uniref:PPPDE domain-containing protein n=1 Tax=Tritrichomonas musculus TaxID=1915356 RepID=A0ABR2HPF3_9EUKA
MTDEIVNDFINNAVSSPKNNGSCGPACLYSSYISNSSSNEHSGEFVASIDDIQRKELLEQPITGITIGLLTLTPKWANIKYAIALALKKRITQYFPPILYHASILFHQDEDSKNGVMIEYGQYDNDDIDGHLEKVHYWDKDGLRFSKMTYAQYDKYVKPLLIGRKYHFIDCEIKRPMTVRELIEQCTIVNSWRKKDFMVEDHNCQDFASLVINKLVAYRHEINYKQYPSDEAMIPYKIFKQLIFNEIAIKETSLN